MTVQKKDH